MKIFFERIGDFNLKKLKVWTDLSLVSSKLTSQEMIKLEELHCFGSERTFTALSKPTPQQLKSIFAAIMEEENFKLRNRANHT